MKKCLALLLFLLTFSHCAKVDDPGPDRMTGKNLPVAGDKASQNVAFPSLSRVPETRMKVRKKHRDHTSQSAFDQPPGAREDSLLRSLPPMPGGQLAEPDMNEPLNSRKLTGNSLENIYRSMIMLSPETILRINFDNDILDYTDRFYTNGFRIELISPVFQATPVRKLFLPYGRAAINYYGLAVVQNMYTPSTTKIGGILDGDRPYAAYLSLASFRITNDPARHFRQKSEIDLGIIGPGSYGEWVQRSFHNSVPTNHEPLGWEYQVRNDLVLNYNLDIEKGIVNTGHFEMMVNGSGSLGTLYTHISGGFHLRTGWLNPYFANLGVSKKRILQDAGMKKGQAFLYFKGNARLVGYDATMQGGMLDRSSPYIFTGNEISRFVFQASGGLALSYNGFRLDVEQFLLSPEFHNGWWHKWVHLSLSFAL